MQITIPDELAELLGGEETEIQAELIVSLYRAGRVTLAQAARALGVDRIGFQRLLDERDFDLTYSPADLDADLRAASWFETQ